MSEPRPLRLAGLETFEIQHKAWTGTATLPTLRQPGLAEDLSVRRVDLLRKGSCPTCETSFAHIIWNAYMSQQQFVCLQCLVIYYLDFSQVFQYFGNPNARLTGVRCPVCPACLGLPLPALQCDLCHGRGTLIDITSALKQSGS